MVNTKYTETDTVVKLRKEWNVWFGLNMENEEPAAYL